MLGRAKSWQANDAVDCVWPGSDDSFFRVAAPFCSDVAYGQPPAACAQPAVSPRIETWPVTELDADHAGHMIVAQAVSAAQPEDRQMTTALPIDQMIDIEHGTISREIFVSPEFYQRGTGEAVHPRLAVRRPREPDSQAGRLFRLPHGRGIGDPVPRHAGRGARVPELLPSSRHEGVPLRAGQHLAVRLPVSFVELHHRRQVAGRAAVSRAVRGHAQPRGMVADRGAKAGDLQGHRLGVLGPGGAGFHGIPGRTRWIIWTRCWIAATDGRAGRR